MNINFKRLHPDAVTPSYAKEGDVGLDLTVVNIKYENEFIQYHFGIAVEIPLHYFGLMVPRSSITKMNLMMKNSVGIIDSGYRGELVMRCQRAKSFDATDHRLYKIGEKAAQLLILPAPQINLVEVEELSESQRGTGGFGSTDENTEGRV